MLVFAHLFRCEIGLAIFPIARLIQFQVDVRIVIAMTISVISMVQYYSSWTNYEDAIKYIMTVPKYRLKATEIAKEDGLLKAATDKKANRGKTKEQIKEQEESVLRKVSCCGA